MIEYWFLRKKIKIIIDFYFYEYNSININDIENCTHSSFQILI